MPPLLHFLALCNLVIGTGAFVLSGVLVPVAESLQVTVPAAGQAMTAYALATALLAPLALVATGRWPRRRALAAGMAAFGLGNLVCAAAGSLALLLAGRVLMGVGAMFTALAAGIAVALAAPEQRGRALALVFVGMSLSYVIGVPLGAWLGLELGWRWPVAATGVLALVFAVLLAWRLPARIEAPGAAFDGVGALLRRREVLLALGLTLTYFVAIFAVFSYIGPVLKALAGVSPGGLSVTLALFGLSGVAGTALGGLANDRFGPERTLRAQLAVLGAMMALLPLTQGHYGAMLAALLVWGVAGFGMMTPQQVRLAALAPAQAPILLSLNASMLYLGTAAGAAVGGAASAWVGFERLGWVAAPFALLGLVFLHLGRMSRLPISERS